MMQLSIQSVSQHYRRDFRGLRGFSLELEPDVLGLIDPNGAGKSTLMRILATVTEMTEGTVTWNGVEIAKHPNELRQMLGYLLRLTLIGEWSSRSGLIAGILFVPALAMALGVWTDGSKPFEGGYLFLGYVASMYSIPTLDFIGRVPAARETGVPLVYLLIGLLPMVPIYFGRRRQAIK